MPGVLAKDVMDGDQSRNEDDDTVGDNKIRSPRSTLTPHSPRSDSIDLAIDGVIDTSIDHLYHNICEMQSSDPSPSRASYFSYGQESRIDSELFHLVGVHIAEMEISKGHEVASENKQGDGAAESTAPEDVSNGSSIDQNKAKIRAESLQRQLFRMQSEFGANAKSTPKGRSSHQKPPTDRQFDKKIRNPNVVSSLKKEGNLISVRAKFQKGSEHVLQVGLDNPDLGPFLLKITRDMISSGENPRKALEFALRATKSFEVCANEEPNLYQVMSLHVLAAIYCCLGQYGEAIPVLKRSIEIPAAGEDQNHALAKFAGCMQLGDTYTMLGQSENSILCYTAGLEIQRQVLGETDPRVGETCRYVAEAHVQALQVDEAESLCQMALDIHREKGGPPNLEEAADRRLMGIICDAKRDHESALEHYMLARMAMAANGHDIDVASIDCSIGDAYLSLARYDEAIFTYQKALTVFKSRKGENHPAVASVYVRFADLYNKIGKFRDSKSYCENALRIYEKSINPGIHEEEIASGFLDISALYQSMNELDQALKLLKKASKMYGISQGQHSTVTVIEAQMGVMYYLMGNYADSYRTFKSAVAKFRACGDKKSALFGIALNQMGLASVQCYAINEAADLFEEARSILEKEYGPHHPDTLGVYSNLAATYDAMGRLDDAIEILDYVVGMREEKLGTANPDVDNEKQRLVQLLKEAGRVRNRKSKSLVTLLNTDFPILEDDMVALRYH